MPAEHTHADHVSELARTFAAFQDASDVQQRVAETKAADVLLEEKVARIDKALERLTLALQRPGGHAGGQLAAQGAGARQIEHKAAFSSFLRAGQVELAQGASEWKGLTNAANSAGLLAPPELDRAIERRLNAVSPMRQIASVRTTGSGVFRKPVSLGANGGWVAETGARTETAAPALSFLDFPTAELYAMPAATQALLDDAFVDLEEWLAGEVEEVFAAQENTAFVTGDGVNKPKGFLNQTFAAEASHAWGQIGYIATGTDGALPASNGIEPVIDLVHALKAPFRQNARFVMNRRTMSALRKLKDGDGRYVWAPPAGIGQSATLMGFPVTEIEAMPDIGAGAHAIAFGDFARGYLIVDRAGTQVLRDPYSAKPNVLFYVTKRVGGGVQNFDAIKTLKFATS